MIKNPLKKKQKVNIEEQSELQVELADIVELPKSKEVQKEEQIEELINHSFLKQHLDEGITDISFNGTHLWVQSNSKGRYKTEEQPSLQEVQYLGNRIADIQGKEYTDSDPILDTEISNLRANFMHQAISPIGDTFAFRISNPKLAIKDFTDISTVQVEGLLQALMGADVSLIISGRTGSGKTEVQKFLVKFIPDNKKITLIEDTMDSHIKVLYPDKDINSWRTLKEFSRARKIHISDEIQAGLRNNPDWIIIGETRGGVDANEMLQAAISGHSTETTLHSESAYFIPKRLVSMISETQQINEILKGKDIVDAIPIGLHMHSEFKKGVGFKRYIRELVEFTDFTETGAVCNTLYRCKKVLDEAGNYQIEHEYGVLSDKLRDKLMLEEVYHLLPEIFKKKG